MKNQWSVLSSLTLVFVGLIVLHTNAEELKKFIPSSSELSGFKMTEEPEYYNQENLWDYINGSAPGYLAYGFQKMVTFIVMNLENRLELAIDIYDMGDTLSAFGIYSVERSPDGRPVNFGCDGFQSDNTLYFWKNKYYVKLMAYDVTPEMGHSLSHLARIIAQKIPEGGKLPRLFSIFPPKGLVKRSERYIPQDVLGQDYFKHGYSMEYDRDDNKYQVFLICGKNRNKAKENFQEYLKYLSTTDRITHENLEIGDIGIAGTHSYYGTVLFARKGAFIIGVLGCDDQQEAQVIIRGMFTQLSEVTRSGEER